MKFISAVLPFPICVFVSKKERQKYAFIFRRDKIKLVYFCLLIEREGDSKSPSSTAVKFEQLFPSLAQSKTEKVSTWERDKWIDIHNKVFDWQRNDSIERSKYKNENFIIAVSCCQSKCKYHVRCWSG